MPNAADIIATRLHDAGCRTAFGIPGGEVLALVDGLRAAGIEFLLCKHENAGGFMAEGVHHATGAPAVLIATIGPGAVNLVNVVANAYQDRVPMIVITGCVDPAEAATYTHQVLDHRAVLGPVTKASFTVVDGAVGAIVDKALSIAMDGQPGPVHLDLPIGVAAADQGNAPAPHRAAVAPAAPAPGPDWNAARALLADAERPVLIAGVDALNDDAGPAIAEFARAFGVPVITTYKAKGVFPETDRLSLGAAGLSPKADGVLLPFLRRADLVVLAGYDPIEMRTGWRDPWPSGAAVIEFGAVPNTHYVHQARHSFVCDTGAGLTALGAGIAARDTWSGGDIAAARRALAEAFPGDEEWGPAAVIDAVQKAVPANTLASVDTGAHRILLSQMWQCTEPRSLMQSTAFCTMGCALPLAIGRKHAEPDRPVVAFTGDAGLEMVMGELATLRDLRLPVIIIVFVDASLALIELKQRDRGLINSGVDFGATDFVALARAMGGTGVAASDRPTLTQAVTDALDRDGFTLIACMIGEKPYDGRF